MMLSVASGKGGTGKTTVAVSLAVCAEPPVRLLDCDVEEPNAHIFIRPIVSHSESVNISVPQVDESLCTSCGRCADLCKFNAIVLLKKKPLIFPELCHSCGGCSRVCPSEAITEREEPIGDIVIGKRGRVEFVEGKLLVGKSMSPPVIRAVKRYAKPDIFTIVDCPPGTSCSVITAVRGSDYVLLVTEPTPFGLNDLMLAVETMRELSLPFGVVINRCDAGDDRVEAYCREEGLRILARIPEDRHIAELYSRGEIICAVSNMRKLFAALYDDVLRSMVNVCGKS